MIRRNKVARIWEIFPDKYPHVIRHDLDHNESLIEKLPKQRRRNIKAHYYDLENKKRLREQNAVHPAETVEGTNQEMPPTPTDNDLQLEFDGLMFNDDIMIFNDDIMTFNDDISNCDDNNFLTFDDTEPCFN
ncbi:hypothetical protein M9Y10_018278 [Tritrichomonas musculus]|uniref:Uncharacterized protein n=1 Tax=Tritrichomonas musculus TaxID=1915356 RepID=A0ABR2HP58_9EUKA